MEEIGYTLVEKMEHTLGEEMVYAFIEEIKHYS